jgi:hypothetical protein
LPESFGTWLSPHEEETLTAERAAQIKQRFFDALKIMEIEHRAPRN